MAIGDLNIARMQSVSQKIQDLAGRKWQSREASKGRLHDSLQHFAKGLRSSREAKAGREHETAERIEEQDWKRSLIDLEESYYKPKEGEYAYWTDPVTGKEYKWKDRREYDLIAESIKAQQQEWLWNQTQKGEDEGEWDAFENFHEILFQTAFTGYKGEWEIDQHGLVQFTWEWDQAKADKIRDELLSRINRDPDLSREQRGLVVAELDDWLRREYGEAELPDDGKTGEIPFWKNLFGGDWGGVGGPVAGSGLGVGQSVREESWRSIQEDAVSPAMDQARTTDGDYWEAVDIIKSFKSMIMPQDIGVEDISALRDMTDEISGGMPSENVVDRFLALIQSLGIRPATEELSTEILNPTIQGFIGGGAQR